MKDPEATSSVGKPQPHESAVLHVTGAARYTDDMPAPANTLHAAVGLSSVAHARLEHIDLDAVRSADGVVAVLTAADIPGHNNHGPILHDDPLLAEQRVEYVGQVVFLVVAETTLQARRAARRANISYAQEPAILDIDSALAAGSHVIPPQTLARGEPGDALARAPHGLSGSFTIGGQDHFYLEGHVALALPREGGDMQIYCSTQHPSEVQHLVAEALGVASHSIVVECRRMGGGFGGKETQPALFASLAALAARATGRPVKLRIDRDDDMTITGKRHPYRVDYDVGFDDAGVLQAVDFRFSSDCGRSADLSGPVNVRTMFHADNAYFLEHVRIESNRLKTHKASNTAFRGFGGPQGMVAIEYVIDEVARALDLDPLTVRTANYYGEAGRDTTPYGMRVEDNILPRLTTELADHAGYARRRKEVAAFNESSTTIKRGIALTPVKFGISFTATHYNQAGALVHVYRDGSVMLNHGGTEMGQGLYTKVAQVVAEEFQIDVSRVRCTATDTGKVPNTSATAASSGSDLNGMAALNAARTIRERLAAFAAGAAGIAPGEVRFTPQGVQVGEELMDFAELVDRAYLARIQLSSTGFYATPKISYDPKTLSGRPFFYFSYGAAVAEVAIDTLTGESKLLRVDILHDVGRSLNPAIDMGQVEGAFLQGVGWLTSEALHWDENGRLTTHAPATYKIPTVTDWPEVFNVALVDWNDNVERTVYRSKAVGEPPFMLAIAVFNAIKEAVAASAPGRLHPRLNAPATPEEILAAIADLRSRGASEGLPLTASG
ncbi:MAG: xanthine dehydrogenase molybdopterin binding subunit [Gammaproteobacteria bacterium]|nr:xanthine dehydrogenase molybdopterin binding subunit [Gammaproteobacteria bacterium]